MRLSLRPLRRVTSTAREVTAELSPEGAGLDRRVPVAPSEVDTEVGQMAESVNTLLGAVETQFAARVASEERMRQFMADASHELRTPLTSIRGYAELARMRRANGTADVDSDADTLNRIESEGTRMSRLVDDLLLLARTDRGAAPQLEPVDTADLVSTADRGGSRRRSRSATSRCAVDPEVPLYGDYDQLLRVVRNLVTNAAVHTAPGGPIRVSAYRDGSDSVLRVDDSGPGLPPDEAAQVFDRFWRADKARTRARGGSGLGMSIVRSIVEAHGGTVRFDSSVRSGSTVTVRLPSSPAPAGLPRRDGSLRGLSVRNRLRTTGHNQGMPARGPSDLPPAIAARLKRDAAGLVVAVVQQHDTGEVLMVGWMDDEALHRTLTTGRATFWSRSRQEYWVKGATSGNIQLVRSVALDCDGDSAAGARRPGRRGVPHRRPHLLRSRRVAGLDRGRGAGGILDVMSAPIGRRELRDLARTHRLVPLTRTLFADAETPVGVYRKLAADRPGTFLLESAEPGRSFSRWSFVGVNAVATLSARAGEAVWSGSGPGRRTDRRRSARGTRRGVAGACAARDCPGCRRSPAASSAISPTTWCAGSRRCPRRPRTTWAFPS